MKDIKNGLILIVNDHPSQIDLLEFELSRAGFRCARAMDGAEAFELARRQKPDLIISDVSMPVMDGIELCRQVRADAELSSTPILLVSALRRDTRSAVAGIETGADDYVEVPYETPLLIAKAARLIERQRLDEERRQSQQFLSTLLDNAPTPVYVQDREHRLRLVNKEWESALWLKRHDVLGKTIFDLFPRVVAEQFARNDRQVFDSGLPGVFEEEHDARCYHTVKFPLFDLAGEVESIGGISVDITDRKEAEQALRESASRLLRQNEALRQMATHSYSEATDLLVAVREITQSAAHALETARVSVWLYDDGRTKIRCLDLYDRNAGSHTDGYELSRENFPGYFRALEEEPTIAADDARQDSRTEEFTDAYLVPQGITSMLDAPIRVGGRVVGVVCHEQVGPPRHWTIDEQNFAGSMSDTISLLMEADERRRAEDALRRSEERFRLVSQATNDLIYDWDMRTDEALWNEAIFSRFGYAADAVEQTLKWWTGRVHPDDRERVNASLHAALRDGERIWSEEYRFQRGDGSYALVLDRGIIARAEGGEPVRMIGTIMDMTERRQTEEALVEKDEQLRQAQKMEAIGRLAGGVAHDFNNLLTAINGYADLSLRQILEDDPLHRNLTEIKKAGWRAADLTRQLLAFSRKQILQPKVLNLNAAVRDLTRMLRRIIGEDIDLQLELAPELGQVKADPGQLEQIVVNLAVNSRDAMPDGGRLTIKTADVELDREFARTHIGIEPGDYVMLAITDTGCGMDEGTQSRIFEPFFTTKEVGKGTGLGLSTVYGIVQQSGGTIWVDSRLEQGTTFTIYLPKVNDQPDHFAAGDNGQLRHGKETVLLVEDDDLVRNIALITLRQSGYKVLEATHGGEALLVAKEYAGRVHLVVTDMVMPRMSGRVLVEHLMESRPDIKVLYMSGYTEDSIFRQNASEDGFNFIAKPLTPESLSRKVREVLDSEAVSRHAR